MLHCQLERGKKIKKKKLNNEIIWAETSYLSLANEVSFQRLCKINFDIETLGASLCVLLLSPSNEHAGKHYAFPFAVENWFVYRNELEATCLEKIMNRASSKTL